jgi:hypothetical protein
MLGCWGFLPIAVPGAVFVGARLGAAAFPTGSSADRALAGAVLFGAAAVGVVQGLAAVRLVDQRALLVALALATLGAAVLVRPPRRAPLGAIVTRATAPLLIAAAVAIVVATLAAYWLPVWQWDALGYHLPYVNFLLQGRGTSGVPDDMPYVSTYPHVIETFVVALRAMLPDDRLVDLAQVPFALVGAGAIAGIARRVGAPRPEAIAAGAAWVVLPAVFLQMPTDYVDVGSAAWLLVAIYFLLSSNQAVVDGGAGLVERLLLGACALGLFLGSKPSAPLASAIVLVSSVVVAVRGRLVRIVPVVVALVVALGGGAFVSNALRYGNPVWPVAVSVGPWNLPGISSMQHLLESGAAAPRLHGSLLWRVARSWTSLTSPPVFDMRIGGLGPLFLAALPAAAVTLWRMRGRRPQVALTGAALIATLATPDPAVARYVLAFPALVFALAAPRWASLPAVAAPWLGVAVGAIALGQLAYALPGLSGEGPPLFAYARMSDEQRAEAVGADGPPTPFSAARRRIAPGETFAFDQSMELPYLAWDGALTRRAVWISDTLRGDAIGAFFSRENARIVVASDDAPTGQWLTLQSNRFFRLFSCKSAPCSVYERR